ncbi:host attachment protein [Microvirga puerhi]|uniref:Host attachment family protein n=1 Tax=Microvirga puerhi TaxID=2876078 RepID=A0ABS7VQ10_9HYPH|nr:host attachment family protein [Microvirga puerhi]MBZ6077003.1 host attachment family protein [Microvirga puerhi]
MTKHLKLPYDGIVLVSDGRKALLLRNTGTEASWNLTVEKVMQAPDNPPTAQQGTDKPGRAFNSTGERSAVEQSDWHALAEARFAEDVAAELERTAAQAKAVIIAAPPRTLAVLRRQLPTSFTDNRIVAEVNKDLTRHPVHEIAAHLQAEQ